MSSNTDGRKDITSNFRGTLVPEFPGSLASFALVIGALMAMVIERKVGPQHGSV